MLRETCKFTGVPQHARVDLHVSLNTPVSLNHANLTTTLLLIHVRVTLISVSLRSAEAVWTESVGMLSYANMSSSDLAAKFTTILLVIAATITIVVVAITSFVTIAIIISVVITAHGTGGRSNITSRKSQHQCMGHRAHSRVIVYDDCHRATTSRATAKGNSHTYTSVRTPAPMVIRRSLGSICAAT